MGNFAIGLSGLKVAQHAIDLVSTNIANASTEGYHRQEAVIRPVVLSVSGVGATGGAEVTEVRRRISNLLELEITRQQSGLSQASEELDVLRTIEAAFGEVGSEGLAVAIDRFFDSLAQLASDPGSQAMRVQTVWAADAVAGQFRNLGNFVNEVENQLRMQAEEYVTQFNDLAAEIHDLTSEMAALGNRGGASNLLLDRRDQAVRDLADLADIQVHGLASNSAESLRITACGTPVVTRASVIQLGVGITDNGQLGVGVEDSGIWQTGARGGRIGAMLALRNDVLSALGGNLDALADRLIAAINSLHVQGVGLAGSFGELTGATIGTEPFSQWDPEVIAGSFYVRLTDTSTGAVTRSKIDVDVTDTITDIRDRLDAVDGLSASVANSALKIEADAGYTFDFMPAVLSDPYTSAITGDAAPAFSGIYTGRTNQVFTCKVVGTGRVGVAGDLSLEVRDGGGQLAETVNIGQGYPAGDPLDIGSGITVALSAGQLNNDDQFTVQALAEADTSGFLAAAGINTLFSGTTASNISVRPDVLAQPQRLAGSIGAAMTDSINIGRMIDVGHDSQAALGNVSIRDYFRNIVTSLGQAVVVREARAGGLENVMAQLTAQRDRTSGVDLNEETAKLIVLERMYQAMARVIAAQNQALGSLLDLL